MDTSAAPTPVQATRTNAPTLPAQNGAPPPRRAPTQPAAATVPVRQAASRPQRQPSDFVDPAILSYGRSPVQARTVAQLPTEPVTPIKSMLAKAAESLPASSSSPFVGEAGKSSGSHRVSRSRDAIAQSQSAAQSAAHQIPTGEADGAQDSRQVENGTKKRIRRGQKNKKNGTTASEPPPVMNVEVSRNGNDMTESVRRGKGWRQDPLLQPSPQTGSPASIGSTKKSKKQAKEARQNGWATEDATDIQDMGDFDFEANHKLFDKKQVFDELRQGDTTADEDRLVNHNKVYRPGTYGGKNLHPTENVLSPQLGPKPNGNELDSTSDADTELNFANGRSSSRHSVSRASLKKQPSRQNSTQVEAKPHPLSASMSSDRGLGLNRSVTSLSRQGRPVPSIATGSPKPDLSHSPGSAVSRTHAPSTLASSQLIEPHLVVLSATAPCPALLPLGLETLEKETVSRYGLTHDAITETAARCIAEMAVGMFDSTTGSRRGSRANTIRGSMSSSLTLEQRNSAPVVVILAGNHAVGARAVAAARHLVCRKTKIIIAEARYESADIHDVQLKTQTSILKRMIKGGASIKRGPWTRASAYIKNLSGPPAVIIDALLAGSTYETLLDSSNAQHVTEAQKEAREMIDWANRSRAPVLSVGCPSGVSGADGTSTTVDGEPLAIRPDKVLCLGAPVQGILDAMKAGERWDVTLADTGINIALRSDEAVPFGAQWVVDLKFTDDEVAVSEVQ